MTMKIPAFTELFWGLCASVVTTQHNGTGGKSLTGRNDENVTPSTCVLASSPWQKLDQHKQFQFSMGAARSECAPGKHGTLGEVRKGTRTVAAVGHPGSRNYKTRSPLLAEDSANMASCFILTRGPSLPQLRSAPRAHCSRRLPPSCSRCSCWVPCGPCRLPSPAG